MRIAIYSRKSKWTGKGESIENQLIMCREYIQNMIPEARDAEIHEYEDEGFSGKNTQRPQFKQMLSDIRSSHFDYLVCYKLDRLGRNLADLALLIEELNKLDIAFVSIKERFDTSTPMGKAMLYMSGVLAQMEREQIAERVRDNMLMLARSGRWLGGNTPLGFDSKKEERVTLDNKVRSSYSLSINNTELITVQFIFNKFLEEQALTKLESYLLVNGIKTRQGKVYQISTIRDILTNPVYCTADDLSVQYFSSLGCQVFAEQDELMGDRGFISYGKTSSGKYKSKDNPTSEWIIAVGKHKGIISSKDWIGVQKLLEVNKKKGEHFRKVQNPYCLLSGLLYCKCGAPMRPKNYPETRLHTDGKRSFAYLCSCKEKSHGKLCSVSNVHGNTLDEVIAQELISYLKPDSQVNHILSELKKRLKGEKGESASETDLFKLQLKEKKYQIQQLLENLSKPGVSDTVFSYINEQITSLDKECKEIEKKIKTSDNVLATNSDIDEQVEIIMGQLKDFSLLYKDLTITERREFMKLILDRVVWDGENAHIFIYGSH
jgi:site-specific DNA recombinase|nr:recombinase family protein [uncultured Lachnoclostridium sp.]